MLKTQSVIAYAAGLLIAGATCAAQSASPSYSHAEVKKMIREAHTAEQYEKLASYFRSQEYSYKQKAAEERREWHRRSWMEAPLYAKYPTPADSSRNRYEYFVYEAQRMSALAIHYEGLTTGAVQ